MGSESPKITPAVQPAASIRGLEVEKPVGKHNDVGLLMYEESLAMDPELRDRLAKRVLRKLDYGLLPVMCIIYLTSFLDKQTLNYASAYSLKTDLGLVATEYSWIAAIINFGILAGSYPASLALQRFPIGKIAGAMLISWGILNMCSAATKNFGGLMAIRFLLGLCEASMGPAWMLLTSVFWTRREQPLRMCFWLGCNGHASMLGAGISWGLGHNDSTAVKSWQLIFLTIGAFTFVFGVLAVSFLPSGPHDAFFLSHEEKLVAVWRVSENKTGIKNPKIMLYQVKEALMEPRVWLLAIQQLCIGITNGGISNFTSSLLLGFGFSSSKSLLYQLPNGAFQLVCTIAAGVVTSTIPNSIVITIAICQIPTLAGVVGIKLIPLEHQVPLAACCWLFGCMGGAIILNWAIVASNFAGHTKRMTVNGLNFVFYYGGNIIGPFLFISKESPKYPTAVSAMASLFSISIASSLLMGLLMALENRKRDKAAGAAQQDPDAMNEPDSGYDGFTDHTDKEMAEFRYKW